MAMRGHGRRCLMTNLAFDGARAALILRSAGAAQHMEDVLYAADHRGAAARSPTGSRCEEGEVLELAVEGGHQLRSQGGRRVNFAPGVAFVNAA